MFFLFVTALILTALLAGCASESRFAVQTGSGIVMGTVFSAALQVPEAGGEAGEGILEEAGSAGGDSAGTSGSLPDRLLYLGEELETSLLSRRVPGSELSRINASAGAPDGYPLSPKMEELLTECLRLSAETDGAFDVTIGALVSLWDIDGWAAGASGGEPAQDGDAGDGVLERGFAPPSEDAITEALACCGYEQVRIADHRIYLPAGMSLDLGAVGKGIFLDSAEELLNGADGEAMARVSGASGAGRTLEDHLAGTVSAGGSVLTYGAKGGGADWTVGVADPFGSAGICGRVSLAGTRKVSTSGDYERYVEADGVRYHHILDPRTGYPVGCPGRSPLASVTVLSGSGFLSDALSTAIFVLGEEDGLAIADRYDTDVILIRRDGTVLSTTDGWTAR